MLGLVYKASDFSAHFLDFSVVLNTTALTLSFIFQYTTLCFFSSLSDSSVSFLSVSLLARAQSWAQHSHWEIHLSPCNPFMYSALSNAHLLAGFLSITADQSKYNSLWMKRNLIFLPKHTPTIFLRLVNNMSIHQIIQDQTWIHPSSHFLRSNL